MCPRPSGLMVGVVITPTVIDQEVGAMTSSVLTSTYPVRGRLRSGRSTVAAAALVVAAVLGFAVGRTTGPDTPAATPATPVATSGVGPATPHDVQQFLAPGHGYTP